MMIEGDKESRAVQDALDLAIAKLPATWDTQITNVCNAPGSWHI
jgi:ribosomal protein L16/L10AE